MDRRKIRLARVGHGLRRLICVTDDGTISLAALRWVTEQQAVFLSFSETGEFSASVVPHHRPRRDSGVRRRLPTIQAKLLRFHGN